MARIVLPESDGSLAWHRMGERMEARHDSTPYRCRVAFAAAHVVPAALDDQGLVCTLDWEATIALREDLWSYGLGVAEAMDTAQRGMGLGWELSRELIRRSAALDRPAGTRLASGANTDQLGDGVVSGDEVLHAYEEQVEHIESCGSQVILMASRHLARCARDREDYMRVYGRLLDQVREPAILHWLGAPFDPLLRGYWGEQSDDRAAEVVLEIIRSNIGKVDGLKVSLLKPDAEQELRRAMPAGVRVYTGDDFHYPELILGDGERGSDALLGIFSGIAPRASAALRALDVGDVVQYGELLAPTVPLSRCVFEAPTWLYKVGLAFLAWISGRQRSFTMLGGLESKRSLLHLVRVFKLADAAGLVGDPDVAVTRMRAYLQVHGIEG